MKKSRFSSLIESTALAPADWDDGRLQLAVNRAADAKLVRRSVDRGRHFVAAAFADYANTQKNTKNRINARKHKAKPQKTK
jgi:hypothetical protein